MKKIILCPKNSGNTYEVCRYVSEKSGSELKVIDEGTDIQREEYDVIILASGIYGGHIHKNISGWIKNLKETHSVKMPKVFLFVTWIGRGKSDKSAFEETKVLLKDKEINLQENYIECFGKSFGIIKRKHPDENDKKKILDWMQQLN